MSTSHGEVCASLFIYNFIYLGSAGSSLLSGLFLSRGESRELLYNLQVMDSLRVASLVVSHRAPRCMSFQWRCGTWAQRLQLLGSRPQAH